MLQVSMIRQQPDRVKERLAVKNFDAVMLVDEIVLTDEKRKNIQLDLDTAQSKVNAASKDIGQLMAKGEKAKAEELKSTVSTLKSQIHPLGEQLRQIEIQLHNLLVQLPNLPASDVPPGNSPDDNIIIRSSKVTEATKDLIPHWDLAKKFNLIDFEMGNKLTGSGFPVFVGKGARLQRALIQYFLDFNIAAGYSEYAPPLLVNETSAFGTGQLPDKEGQMYFAGQDQFYLIPTSEVPLTNIYRDEILKETDLPIRMTAFTPCFRREAGSYGKDVRGLNRVHQFDKVEIVQIVHPEKSYQTLDEMVAHVEKLVQSLDLPYRIVKLCGGDMGFASALTYDFEVFSGAQNKWLEVSSVSNFETFQSYRMKIRFKDSNGKNQFVHTLNGSSLALPRIIACLLENNQLENSITLPDVLLKYYQGKSIELE